MSNERYQRMKSLFQSLVDVSPEDRVAILERECSDDPQLGRELEECLRSYDEELLEPDAEPEIGEGAGTGDNHSGDDELLFGNRYRLGERLGRGGMGEVFRAWDTLLSIEVALKTLRGDLRENPEAQRQLKRELLVARSITHPHVCRVYDCGCDQSGDGERWFLTMELFEGETLAEQLRSHGPLSPDDAHPIVEQMLRGLDAVHRSGIAHLDFKPSNIMLVPDEDASMGRRVVLTDFGIARPNTPKSRPGSSAGRIAGTIGYMAPEQLSGEAVGPGTDIYAFGIVLHEMLAGCLPSDAPISLDSPWGEVIEKCLSRNPNDRFVCTDEIAAALSGAPLTPPVFVRPDTRSLPAERDTFVGRESDRDALALALNSPSRLTTLLGTAGVGKTRLSVHYGWHHESDWPGGVWFVNLMESTDARSVASSVAQVLGVPLNSGDPTERIRDALLCRGKCLVILDNFDRAVSYGRETIGRWLDSTEASFLVTSRERLGLRGEQLIRIESLSGESAAELFVERARQLRPGFAPTEEDMAHVVEIVESVDRIPLAIELAAARILIMDLEMLAQRTEQRLQLLQGGEEGRHHSLRAAIDGSWELMNLWERMAWTQCAVFEGGFTLDAAESVVDLGDAPQTPWVVDVIQSLVDKSLLRISATRESPRGHSSRMRFGMYASLREYALERLDAECGHRAEERHGAWFARFGTSENLAVHYTRGGHTALHQLAEESENLIVAGWRAVRRKDAEVAVSLLTAMERLVELRGLWIGDLGASILRICERKIDRAQTLGIIARIGRLLGQRESCLQDLNEALRLFEELGERQSEAAIHANLGTLHREQARVEEARRHYEAAITIADEIDDAQLRATARSGLGLMHYHAGEFEESVADLDAALKIYQDQGNRWREGIVLNNLGGAHHLRGDTERSLEYWQAAREIFRESGDRRFGGMLLHNLGMLLFEAGDTRKARRYLEECRSIQTSLGSRQSLASTENLLGLICQHDGQPDEAKIHLNQSISIARSTGDRRLEAVALGCLGELEREAGNMTVSRGHLDAGLAIHRETQGHRYAGPILGSIGHLLINENRFAEAGKPLQEGETLLRGIGDISELSKLLCVRGLLEIRMGNLEAAGRLIEEVDALITQLGSGPESRMKLRVAKLRAYLADRNS